MGCRNEASRVSHGRAPMKRRTSGRATISSACERECASAMRDMSRGVAVMRSFYYAARGRRHRPCRAAPGVPRGRRVSAGTRYLEVVFSTSRKSGPRACSASRGSSPRAGPCPRRDRRAGRRAIGGRAPPGWAGSCGARASSGSKGWRWTGRVDGLVVMGALAVVHDGARLPREAVGTPEAGGEGGGERGEETSTWSAKSTSSSSRKPIHSPVARASARLPARDRPTFSPVAS